MSVTSVSNWITNDSHVPIALVVFIGTTIFTLITRTDLPPNYLHSIYALFAFLGGHAAVLKLPGKNNG